MKIWQWSYADAEEKDDSNPVYKIIQHKIDYSIATKFTHNFAEFLHGKIISLPFSEFSTFILNDSLGKFWPDIAIFPMHWILVSSRMRKAIEKFTSPSLYQWIDAKIEGDNTQDYKLFNCLQHIHCLDAKKSILSEHGPPFKPVLRKKAVEQISGPFRIAEEPVLLMVTKNLQDFCVSENIGPVKLAKCIELSD